MENGGLGKLHPKEIELLAHIRTQYRFGLIELETQHGLPHLIRKTVQTQLLKGVDTIAILEIVDIIPQVE